MAFNIKSGDMFAGDHDVLVNAVNCVGVMGAGVALAIRKRCGEEYFRQYATACKDGRLSLGGLHVVWSTSCNFWAPRRKENARLAAVINFPTMQVPGGTVNPSALRMSTARMRDWIMSINGGDMGAAVRSIGIPALGCGIGDFVFSDLVPILRNGLDDIDDVEITLYEPR